MKQTYMSERLITLVTGFAGQGNMAGNNPLHWVVNLAAI